MTEHTPGPWHLSKAGHHTIWNDDEVIVADCDSLDPRHPPADQIGANCHLIAAAPELLAALKLALSSFDNSLRSAGTSTAGFIANRKLMAKAQTQARTAIAKARNT